ncbi:hypothetical protein GCWU000282_00535 [Catonella morbi ATCC 51271]|uniref:Uncharacterized protein n=1 Tax=Catonella morbi ATCC 51271 TaxID=592026 RepID=V2Y5H9_9FIRM|nr:hypothetical protein GCWU000282_00535 [Catonella morbi ATCC 51271]
MFNRKFRRNFLLNKNLSDGCWTRGWEVCLAAPLAREVCASTHFFITTNKFYILQTDKKGWIL